MSNYILYIYIYIYIYIHIDLGARIQKGTVSGSESSSSRLDRSNAKIACMPGIVLAHSLAKIRASHPLIPLNSCLHSRPWSALVSQSSPSSSHAIRNPIGRPWPRLLGCSCALVRRSALHLSHLCLLQCAFSFCSLSSKWISPYVPTLTFLQSRGAPAASRDPVALDWRWRLWRKSSAPARDAPAPSRDDPAAPIVGLGGGGGGSGPVVVTPDDAVDADATPGHQRNFKFCKWDGR